MRVRLKGVNSIRYAWKGGPPLVGEPGSPEFVESYWEAHDNVTGAAGMT